VISLKDVCALLLAGGVGAGSVVAVQQVEKPRTAVRPKAKPAAARPAPPRPKLDDCPAAVAPLGGGGVLPELALGGPQGLPSPLPVPPEASLRPGLGGGLSVGPPGDGSAGVLLPPPPVGPGVPEPAAWGMMVSGFGLIGVALRMGRRSSAPA
jgi:hypothetical protein